VLHIFLTTGRPPAAPESQSAYLQITYANFTYHNTFALYLCAMKVLMVCLGNICRSPLAEAILQKKVEEARLPWIVESTGTNGFHVGEAPHHLSQKVARQNGLDISRQVASRFNAKDLEKYDRIYAMADDVLADMKKIAGANMNRPHVKLFLDELYPGQNRNVPDPWFGGEDGYHEVYELIAQTCDAIIKNYLKTKQQEEQL
jgi:protein-tyrosine phosphatase